MRGGSIGNLRSRCEQMRGSWRKRCRTREARVPSGGHGKGGSQFVHHQKGSGIGETRSLRRLRWSLWLKIQGSFFKTLYKMQWDPKIAHLNHTHGSQGAILLLSLQTTWDSFSKEMDTGSLTWFQQALKKVGKSWTENRWVRRHLRPPASTPLRSKTRGPSDLASLWCQPRTRLTGPNSNPCPLHTHPLVGGWRIILCKRREDLCHQGNQPASAPSKFCPQIPPSQTHRAYLVPHFQIWKGSQG